MSAVAVGVTDRLLALRWPVAAGLVAALLVVWQASADRLPASVPSPREVAAATADLIGSGDVMPALTASLGRAAAGFALAAAAGVVVGVLAGVSDVVEDLVDPAAAALNPLPKIALFPAVAVWLGFTDLTRIVVIFAVCVSPVYLAAHDGVRHIDRHLLWVAQNCGASPLRTVAQVVVPAALPRLLVGVRISLALSVVMIFAVEVIGYPPGLGSLIYRSYLEGRHPRMYAGIVVLAALGFALDSAFRHLARRAGHGQQLGTAGADAD